MEESELALSLIAKKHRLKGHTLVEANAFECCSSLPIAVSTHITSNVSKLGSSFDTKATTVDGCTTFNGEEKMMLNK